MKFGVKISENILHLSMEGDLIGEDNGLDIIKAVNDSIDSGVLKAVVDISGLRYINSSGIGVLITILTKFRNKGGEIFLIEPSENVKKLLIITKLNAIFNMAPNSEEAILALNKVD
ncbi:MAG: STAS domain-containing protein [Cyclobacteriaceae bacterium]|nr:STAS domain-containing protein [Cyclobacteriaceae bacterium]